MTSTASPQQSPPSSDVYDLLTIGFGPASLACAIALVENNQGIAKSPPVYSSLGGLQSALGFQPKAADRSSGQASSGSRTPLVKACYLEKHERFRWHPGMMIEGSTMQISFLKDLATLRNPQSSYTFLSYLASFTPSRLVSFVSLGTFTPSRREFADYLQWCAEKVQREMEQQGGEINYGEEVVAVEAVQGAEGEKSDVRILRVSSRQGATGEVVHRYTRNVVVSTGGSARLPSQLSSPDLLSSGRILHTSAFVETIDPILSSIVASSSSTSAPISVSSSPSSPSPSRPIRLAIIGAGQSAAECFLALRSRLASILPADLEHRPQIDMLFRASSLRPTDEGAFSNEVFDPAISQAMFRLSEEDRERVLKEAKGTNYSIVNPVKLEELYHAMYDQQVEEDISARSPASASDLVSQPRLNIKPFTELVSAEVDPFSSAIILILYNPVLRETREVEYDAVVCGTGYDRQAWRNILFAPSSVLDYTAVTSSSSPSHLPLASVLPPATSSGSSASSPVLSTPPALDLPETAFHSIRRSFIDHSFPPSTSSRSASAGGSSVRDSSRGPSTAASSPPAPGSPTSKHSPAARTGATERGEEQAYPVAENYRLLLPSQTKTGGEFKPTVWLQGSCEKTHGISDSLLSVLAVRSGEVVQSFLKEGWFGEEKQ